MIASMKGNVWGRALGIGLLLLGGALAVFQPQTLPLWPPFLAMALLFLTRSAVGSLLAGSLLGALLLAGPTSFPQELVINHLWPSLMSEWHWSALLFTLLLAAFAAIIERSGALAALLERWARDRPRAAKSGAGPSARLQLSIVALGLVCFFDGLANALMLGRVGRTLADQAQVSREKLSYLVDTTSSAVACLAFLSTWTVTQLSLIATSLEGSAFAEPAYLLFLKSIPANFYCLTSLLLVILSARWNWNPPPMSSTRAREPQAKEIEETLRRPLLSALGPVSILLISVPLAFWVLGGEKAFPTSVSDIQTAFNTSQGPYALILAGAVAILGALIFFPYQRQKAFAAIPAALIAILPALGVLVLAWTLGSTLQALGTGPFLADGLGREFPFRLLPAAVFLLGCVIAFSTGTSWGTMGLLMPIALGTLISLAENAGISAAEAGPILPATIAAVFGGAVFGDHASPFSDTTIVSALACDITTTTHVATQIPYALLAAGGSLLCGYLPLALGAPATVATGLSLSFILAIVLLTRRRFAQDPEVEPHN